MAGAIVCALYRSRAHTKARRVRVGTPKGSNGVTWGDPQRPPRRHLQRTLVIKTREAYGTPALPRSISPRSPQRSPPPSPPSTTTLVLVRTCSALSPPSSSRSPPPPPRSPARTAHTAAATAPPHPARTPTCPGPSPTSSSRSTPERHSSSESRFQPRASIPRRAPAPPSEKSAAAIGGRIQSRRTVADFNVSRLLVAADLHVLRSVMDEGQAS